MSPTVKWAFRAMWGSPNGVIPQALALGEWKAGLKRVPVPPQGRPSTGEGLLLSGDLKGEELRLKDWSLRWPSLGVE